jgi:hypothetical protein
MIRCPTTRSSGAPVSGAAGCPRRFAPQRPVNVNVEAVEKGRFTGEKFHATVSYTPQRKDTFQ